MVTNEQVLKDNHIRNLLFILKRQLKKGCITGLCNTIDIIHYREIITTKDALILHKIIRENKPKDTWYYRNFVKDGGYYWKKGVIKPRIEFIDKLIKHYGNYVY